MGIARPQCGQWYRDTLMLDTQHARAPDELNPTAHACASGSLHRDYRD
jgi:hypothetical protein